MHPLPRGSYQAPAPDRRAKFSLDTFVERQRARGRGAAKFRLSELDVAGEAGLVGLLPKNHGSPRDRVSARLTGGAETGV